MRNLGLLLTAGGVLLCCSFASAQLTDKIGPLPVGHLIGGNYTFQNGNPSIPMAKDTVAADGTVSFVKPNAPFDGIEYWDFTTDQPIVALINPINDPIDVTLTSGMRFPILYSDSACTSFFDVFTDLSLTPFNNSDLDSASAFNVGQIISFVDGASNYPGLTIPGLTGPAYVGGFDLVLPEPASLALLAVGALGFMKRPVRRSSK